MTTVRLIDNQQANPPVILEKEGDRHLLSKYSGKTLRELKSCAGERLIVIGETPEADDELPLYQIVNASDDDSKTLPRISTGNLMGVLNLRDESGCHSLKVEVRSRFDQGEPGQPFLCYLLSKVFNVSYLDVVKSGNQSWLEVLLAIRFVWKLAEARSVGLYRQYRTFRCNDLKPRGRIDMARHIRENVPIGVGMAYAKQEISYDVPLNHLLRYAASKIVRKWPKLFQSNEDASRVLIDLKTNTPTWGPLSVRNVLGMRENIEPLRHPFYAEHYEELRVLARMILMDEGADLYEDGEGEVSGVLFSGAWLWEEYLATVLASEGYTHAICGTAVGRRDIFKEGFWPGDVEVARMYPDFYSARHRSVLDAKYKRDVARREDVLQLLAYVLNTGATCAGLIFPPSPDWDSHERQVVNHAFASEQKVLWRSFAFKSLPVSSSADEVEDFMTKQEARLREFVKEKIDD